MVTTHTPHTEQSRVLAIRRHYRLPHAQAIVLDLLLDGELVSIQDMLDAGAAPTAVTARVVVHRVRNFLQEKDIRLQSLYATGYSIEEAPREKLLEALRPLLPAEVTEEAQDVRRVG